MFKPFDDGVIDFVSLLSQQILTNKQFRQYPEIIAMAHWLRKANILKLKREFMNRQGSNIWLPRGMVFHIAPSNVDTIFIYSWVLSLLCGNSNIVRLSSRSGTQAKLILNLLNAQLENTKYKKIKSSNLFVQYGHDEHKTAELSQRCDMRVIWGGDETIQCIRQIPVPTHANELVFASKFSMAVLSANAVNNLDDVNFKKLIKNFFDDNFTFNQQACSSARCVFWMGSEMDCVRAKKAFWQGLENYMDQFEIPNGSVSMSQFVNTCELVANGDCINQYNQKHQLFRVLPINSLTDNHKNIHSGNGIFLEQRINHLDEIYSQLGCKDQTISTFGVSKCDLNNFILALPSRSIDRIVPIGQALQFQSTWDGYPLLQAFTREVNLVCG